MRQIHIVILKFFKREQSDAIYSQVQNYEKKKHGLCLPLSEGRIHACHSQKVEEKLTRHGKYWISNLETRCHCSFLDNEG